MLFYIRGYNLDLRPKDCVLTLCWSLNFHDWTPTNLSSRHSQGLSWDCKARHLPTVLWMLIVYLTYCCCLVTKSCLTFCDPLDCSMPGFPVLHYLLKFAQTQVHWSVMPSHHLVLCFLLLLTYSSRERENQETRWHKSSDFAPVAPRRKAVKLEIKVSSPSAFLQEASSSVLHSKSNEELSNNLYSSSTTEPSDPQF